MDVASGALAAVEDADVVRGVVGGVKESVSSEPTQAVLARIVVQRGASSVSRLRAAR